MSFLAPVTSEVKSYFGTKFRVAFDDGERYTGVIVGRDEKSGHRVTRFEDGTEDQCKDPAKDNDYQIVN